MGGMNETTIHGLRLHIENNMVHVHDDSKSLKFEMHKSDFKTEIEDAIRSLDVTDGLVKLPGTKDDLCIVSDGCCLSMYLVSKKNIKNDLQNFIKSC